MNRAARATSVTGLTWETRVIVAAGVTRVTTVPWVRNEEEQDGYEDARSAADEVSRPPAVVQDVGRSNVVALIRKCDITSCVNSGLYYNQAMIVLTLVIRIC